MSTVPDLEERYVIVVIRRAQGETPVRRYYTGLRNPETGARLLTSRVDDRRTLAYCRPEIARKEVAHHLADLDRAERPGLINAVRVLVEHRQIARLSEGASA